MMGPYSRLWFLLHSCMHVFVALSGVSGQPTECDNLKSSFPRCRCSRQLDSSGATLGTSVDCSSQGLNVIPSSTSSFTIYELKLNNNSISSLGDSILSNVAITKLDLSDNPIGSVHDHAFGYLGSHLKILILSGNYSSQPPTSAFQHLKELEDLTLQNYDGSHLTPSAGYFLPLIKLKNLTLDNWNLEVIEPGSIQITSTNRLQSLTLLNQVMTVLPHDELHSAELTDLKTLRISHTNIQSITLDSFEMLNSLTELDLSYNNITSLDFNCFNRVNDTLVKLSLSNNMLTSWLPGLTDLVNLQQLDLSFNQITNIPELSMIHTTKPLALYLHHNNISAVPETAFVGIADKLKTIDLSYNKILNIQANLGRFSQIESFFLSDQSGNSPLVLPSSLVQAARTLKQLSVGGHKIDQSNLWSVVGQLYMLEVLNLTSAELISIPNLVLSNLTHLNKLDLSNNSLQNITQNTLVGPRNSLNFLSLTRNSISTLLSCMFYQFTSYPIVLLLGENRLVCDCSVRWLWNSIRNGNISSTAGQEAICSDNQLLANKTADSFCKLPSTEPQCVEYYAISKLTIFVEEAGPNSIKISWQLSETNDVKEFQITVSDSHNPSPVFEGHALPSSSQVVNNKLVENTQYEVCVQANFNTFLPISNCTHITIPANSTEPPAEQDGLTPTEIGIIVGVIVGAVVLLALVAAIVYMLVCHRRSQKKDPNNVPVPPRNFSKSELPSMNEETRTFTKPKRNRGASGPETREGMQVVAISDGQTGHGRVGRAHMLNADGSFKKTRTSNSSSISGQASYENDHGPLPPTPNGHHLTPNGHHLTRPHVGYYNNGFKEDSYDEIVPKRESVI